MKRAGKGEPLQWHGYSDGHSGVYAAVARHLGCTLSALRHKIHTHMESLVNKAFEGESKDDFKIRCEAIPFITRDEAKALLVPQSHLPQVYTWFHCWLRRLFPTIPLEQTTAIFDSAWNIGIEWDEVNQRLRAKTVHAFISGVIVCFISEAVATRIVYWCLSYKVVDDDLICDLGGKSKEEVDALTQLVPNSAQWTLAVFEEDDALIDLAPGDMIMLLSNYNIDAQAGGGHGFGFQLQVGVNPHPKVPAKKATTKQASDKKEVEKASGGGSVAAAAAADDDGDGVVDLTSDAQKNRKRKDGDSGAAAAAGGGAGVDQSQTKRPKGSRQARHHHHQAAQGQDCSEGQD